MSVLWGNPLALLGALLVAVPILVHLLATLRARQVAFPSLRFLPETAPTSASARALDDRWLLALRCLIVALAAVALAQPYLARSGDTASAPGTRAIVVDGSSSMARASIEGGPAAAVAEALAANLAADAAIAEVVVARDLRAGIAAARRWLETQGPGGELVVISDFQRGSLASRDLVLLPESYGIRLVRVDVEAGSTFLMPPLSLGGRAWSATAEVDGEGLDVSWVAGATDDASGEVESLVAADDVAGSRAAEVAAARVVPVSVGAQDRPVTVIWPGAPGREALLEGSSAPDAPWMADVLAGLPGNVVRESGSREGRLLLLVDVEPGTMAAANFHAALRRTADAGFAAALELEPESIAAAEIAAWEREAFPVAQSDAAAAGVGRWLWLVVLGLLLVEHVVRRRPLTGGSRVS